jgi:hypothetical protein
MLVGNFGKGNHESDHSREVTESVVCVYGRWAPAGCPSGAPLATTEKTWQSERRPPACRPGPHRAASAKGSAAWRAAWVPVRFRSASGPPVTRPRKLGRNARRADGFNYCVYEGPETRALIHAIIRSWPEGRVIVRNVALVPADVAVRQASTTILRTIRVLRPGSRGRVTGGPEAERNPGRTPDGTVPQRDFKEAAPR